MSWPKNDKMIYYLQTCDTCRRILKSFDFSDFQKHEIKGNPLVVDDLEKLHALAGSYEALFSKRAKRYKEMGLKDQILTEEDYRIYLLQDYTFLKRPVVVVGNQIFIGSEKKTLSALEDFFND